MKTVMIVIVIIALSACGAFASNGMQIVVDSAIGDDGTVMVMTVTESNSGEITKEIRVISPENPGKVVKKEIDRLFYESFIINKTIYALCNDRGLAHVMAYGVDDDGIYLKDNLLLLDGIGFMFKYQDNLYHVGTSWIDDDGIVLKRITLDKKGNMCVEKGWVDCLPPGHLTGLILFEDLDLLYLLYSSQEPFCFDLNKEEGVTGDICPRNRPSPAYDGSVKA